MNELRGNSEMNIPYIYSHWRTMSTSTISTEEQHFANVAQTHINAVPQNQRALATINALKIRSPTLE